MTPTVFAAIRTFVIRYNNSHVCIRKAVLQVVLQLVTFKVSVSISVSACCPGLPMV